jgi:hypothetical protein
MLSSAFHLHELMSASVCISSFCSKFELTVSNTWAPTGRVYVFTFSYGRSIGILNLTGLDSLLEIGSEFNPTHLPSLITQATFPSVNFGASIFFLLVDFQ